MLAVVPEIPGVIAAFAEEHSYEFTILSDRNNELAKKLGIAFKLDDRLDALYKKFGIDLLKTQGNNNSELPLPATFVVNRNGKIILKHVDTDYTKRLEPEDVLSVL